MTSQTAQLNLLLQRWRGFVFDLFFPPRCVNCKRVGKIFCTDCRSQIQPLKPPYCRKCAHPLRFAHARCPNCSAHPLSLELIRSAGYFEGALREAIHAFKYNGRTELAEPLAELLNVEFSALEIAPQVITAVPLHPDRQRARGYNQAELLGRELARLQGTPYAAELRRVRATEDQIGLDAYARHNNVRNAFSADQAAFRGRRVVVIDDVCTTGATLDACAVALLASGASAVYGLTVARPR